MPAVHTDISSPQLVTVPGPHAAGMERLLISTTPSSRITYWPVGPMQAFTLRMASHGLCVSSAMMLGDRPYAMAQLARAHALNDEGLRELAVLLFQQLEAQH